MVNYKLAMQSGNKESTLSLRVGRPPRLEIRNTCKVGSCQLPSKGQQLREHARDGKRGDVDMCHSLNCKNIPYAAWDFQPGWEKGTCQDCQIPVGIAQNMPRGLISIGIASVYPVLQKASRQAIQWQPSKDSVVLVFLQTLG